YGAPQVVAARRVVLLHPAACHPPPGPRARPLWREAPPRHAQPDDVEAEAAHVAVPRGPDTAPDLVAVVGGVARPGVHPPVVDAEEPYGAALLVDDAGARHLEPAVDPGRTAAGRREHRPVRGSYLRGPLAGRGEERRDG